MRVLVLGGGVVGVTTAYQLQKDGHEVVLLERRAEVADETSYGNAGMIAPGHSFVWSSPSAPITLLKSLFLPDQALRFRLSADPHMWAWSLKFLMECTAGKARRNTLLKHRLAVHSQGVLGEVVRDEGLDYDRNTGGILYFHRDAAALARGIENMKLLQSDGQEIRILDRDGVVSLEPALARSADGIAGAIFCPTDETGNSAKFTRALAAAVASRGGTVLTGTTIKGIDVSADRVEKVRTDKGDFAADAYVLSLGVHSAAMARSIGLALPIYPIKGYSLTVPVTDAARVPRIATLDEHNLVAITPMGDRLRLTATAEFADYDTTHKPSDFDFMKKVAMELYPDGADYPNAEMWAGLRPMTPDNLPVLGQRKYRNLWLNTGHGHIGWTMSHGSARITADLVAGRKPPIPLDGILPA